MRLQLQLILALIVGLLAGPAFAQEGLDLLGVDNGVIVASGGAYVGPGNIVSGAKAFYGLRAYNDTVAAAGTQKLVNVTRASDSMSCDVKVATSGDVGNVITTGGCTASGAASAFCNATTCTVNTWYDQVGGFDAAPAGAAPTLVFSCLGAKPCLAFNGSQGLDAASGTSTAQGVTISAVAIRTGNTGAQNDILVSTATGVYFNNAASQVSGYFGNNTISPTAADSAWHALQFVVNGSSSTINVDGTPSSGDMGANALSADWFIGRESGGMNLTGKMGEVGIWGPALTFSSGQQTSMNTNQHAYWGF